MSFCELPEDAPCEQMDNQKHSFLRDGTALVWGGGGVGLPSGGWPGIQSPLTPWAGTLEPGQPAGLCLVTLGIPGGGSQDLRKHFCQALQGGAVWG